MKERVENLNMKVSKLQDENERVNKRAETAMKQLNQEFSSARNNLAKSTEQLQRAQDTNDELRLQVEQLAKSNAFYRTAMSQESSRHAMTEIKSQLTKRAQEVLQATKILKDMVATAKRELRDDFFNVKITKNIEIFKMKLSEEIKTKRFLEQSVSRYKRELSFATRNTENSVSVVPLSTTARSIGNVSEIGFGETKGIPLKPQVSNTVSPILGAQSATSISATSVMQTPTIPKLATPFSEVSSTQNLLTANQTLYPKPFVPSFLANRNKENLGPSNSLSNKEGSGIGCGPSTPVKRPEHPESREGDKTVGRRPEVDDKLDLRAIELETLEISRRIERLKGGSGTQQPNSAEVLILSQRSFLDSSKGGAGTNRFFYEDSAT